LRGRTTETLPGSLRPDELKALGYDLQPVGEGQRILASGITERFTRRADGELELMAEGSTNPVAEIRQHAGIVKVEVYEAILP
jgi:hypothetical protein